MPSDLMIKEMSMLFNHAGAHERGPRMDVGKPPNLDNCRSNASRRTGMSVHREQLMEATLS